MAKQILEVTDVRITNVPQWTPSADGALLSSLSTTGVPKLPLAPANHKLANPRLWYSSGATWEKTAAAVTKSGFPATAAMCSFRFYGALRGCVPKRTEVTLPVGKDGVPLIGRAADVKPAAGVPTVVVVAKPAAVAVPLPAAVEKDADEEQSKKRKRKSDDEDDVVPNEAAAVTKKVKADDDDKEAKKRAKEAEKEAKRAEKEAKKRAKEAEKEAKRKLKEEAKAAKGK
ncbi:hypothetical protein GGF32_007208 [Allomyces javanicus]|nr:hypothetical protein GGF32_007208 [Allomyces javanicus]